MSSNIRCLKKACDALRLHYEDIGTSHTFLSVQINGTAHYFIANAVPFNNPIVTRIALDKSYTYDLLASDLRLPHTCSYIDPDCEDIYKPYVKFSQLEIANDIKKNFPFPIIVKKNSGSRGELVFSCNTDQELKDAIQSIFNQASSAYDFILLAQEHITIKKEFRVTVLQNKIVLIYEKDFANARFVGNLSPLHWEGARARIVEDNQLQEQIGKFIEPLFRKLDLQYGGLDIALDENNQFCLFEINTEPGYTILSESYGDAPLIELYRKMLVTLGAK